LTSESKPFVDQIAECSRLVLAERELGVHGQPAPLVGVRPKS
jgi:hypothetical protein